MKIKTKYETIFKIYSLSVALIAFVNLITPLNHIGSFAIGGCIGICFLYGFNILKI